MSQVTDSKDLHQDFPFLQKAENNPDRNDTTTEAGNEKVVGSDVECNMTSTDKTLCFIFINKSLSFEEASSLCSVNYSSRLPSVLSEEEVLGIAQSFNLSFWLGIKGSLVFDEPANRVWLENYWIYEEDYLENKWDIETFDIGIYWKNESYCAEAVYKGNTSVWNPRNCNEKSTVVVCQRLLLDETSKPMTDNMTLDDTQLQSDPSATTTYALLNSSTGMLNLQEKRDGQVSEPAFIDEKFVNLIGQELLFVVLSLLVSTALVLSTIKLTRFLREHRSKKRHYDDYLADSVEAVAFVFVRDDP